MSEEDFPEDEELDWDSEDHDDDYEIDEDW